MKNYVSLIMCLLILFVVNVSAQDYDIPGNDDYHLKGINIKAEIPISKIFSIGKLDFGKEAIGQSYLGVEFVFTDYLSVNLGTMGLFSDYKVKVWEKQYNTSGVMINVEETERSALGIVLSTSTAKNSVGFGYTYIFFMDRSPYSTDDKLGVSAFITYLNSVESIRNGIKGMDD